MIIKEKTSGFIEKYKNNLAINKLTGGVVYIIAKIYSDQLGRVLKDPLVTYVYISKNNPGIYQTTTFRSFVEYYYTTVEYKEAEIAKRSVPLESLDNVFKDKLKDIESYFIEGIEYHW